MGGLGSGKSFWKKRIRTRTKFFTNELPYIDVSQLMKLHNKYPEGVLTWRDLTITIDHMRACLQKEGFLTPSFGIKAIPCNYGGFRYSACCPCCHKWVKFLYQCKATMGCRHCLNLAYRSQNATLATRMLYKKWKSEEKHGKLGYEKPKWMRWPTFEKVREHQSNLDELNMIADFFSLRRGKDANKILKKHGCALFAAESFSIKHFGY